MYKYMYNKIKLPVKFHEMLIQNANVHDHFTRQRSKLHVHKASNTAVVKTMQYIGTYFWYLLSPKLNLIFS